MREGRGAAGPGSARPPHLRTPRPSHPRAAAPPYASAPPLRARHSGYCSPATRSHGLLARRGNYTSRRAARRGHPHRRAVLLRPARRSPAAPGVAGQPGAAAAPCARARHGAPRGGAALPLGAAALTAGRAGDAPHRDSEGAGRGGKAGGRAE